MVEALRCDAFELEAMSKHQMQQQQTFANPQDAWAAIDASVGRKARGGAKAAASAAAAAEPAAAPADAEAAAAAGGEGEDDASKPDYMRVRMKRSFPLWEMADALVNGGGGGGPTSWPLIGLLLFPGHANPQLPLEPIGEWKKEFSNSQQRSYW